MKERGRIYTGFIVSLLGLFLVLLPFFIDGEGRFFILIWGIPLLILGIFILLNKNEDKIEQIRRK